MESLDNITIVQLTYAGILFVFGLVMGSFLNVVAYRTPTGASIISPPSSCPKCGRRIASHDNVPLIGWLVLGGKCRNCREPISVRYPLVELATGILWALAGWRLAGLDQGYYHNVFIGLLELAFVSAMVVTFLVDLDFLIILDEISLGGLAVALVASVLLPGLHSPDELDLPLNLVFAINPELALKVAGGADWVRGLLSSLLGMGVGLGFSLFMYFVGSAMFRKQIEEAQKDDPEVDSALGLGDVKLMAFFGAFLGWQAVLFTYIAACVLGTVIGMGMKLASGDAGGAKGLSALLNRWRTGNSVIPFGPFLVVGVLVYLFWGQGIIDRLVLVFP